MNNEIKVAFSVTCTKTIDNRFTVGKTYCLYYRVRGEKRIELAYLAPESIVDEEELRFTSRLFSKDLTEDVLSFYRKWYDDCFWTNYDFELVYNEYSVDLI